MIAVSGEMSVFPARELAYPRSTLCNLSHDKASAGDPIIRNDKPYLLFKIAKN